MGSLFISADIEGVAGVVSWDQTRQRGFEYEAARRWMTAEVNAAIAGARSAGAGRIVIADSHGNGQNLLLDMLPADVEVVRCWPRPLSMMQGIETGGFEAVFCLGYHTGAAEVGLLNHTIHGGAFTDVRLNGRSVSELEIFAAVAGAHGAPIALVSGDEAFCAHAEAVAPMALRVAVKSASGRVSARTIMPSAACARLEEAAAIAWRERTKIAPHLSKSTVRLAIDFKWHHPAETLALLDRFERSGAHTIETSCADHMEVVRVIEFITHFRLAPE
jgi:D-amino peptidase